jgi:multidrug/hemolysin transport system ATP-binding protein
MKLKEKYTSNVLRLLPLDKNKLIKYLNSKKLDYKVKADNFEILLKSSMESLNILKEIEDNLSSFEVLEGNMDTVFVNLTGKDIREV